MSWMRHHAIIVTSWNDQALNEAMVKAQSLGLAVAIGEGRSAIQINGYRSFLVPPDGSKEGWPESDKGDAARAAFREYLDVIRYEDGSSPLDWIEVAFGECDREGRIIATTWTPPPDRAPHRQPKGADQ